MSTANENWIWLTFRDRLAQAGVSLTVLDHARLIMVGRVMITVAVEYDQSRQSPDVNTISTRVSQRASFLTLVVV